MRELMEHLNSLPEGPVSDASALETLPASCWNELDGGDAEGMADYKISGRLERPVWNPPILTFVIERHGGTVAGSSRAELQHWNIDTKKKAASCGAIGHRQLYPMQSRLNVIPFAEEIVKSIVERASVDYLRWRDDGHVQVLVGKFIPEDSAVPQTLAGRRKRLRKAVEERLRSAGWKVVRANVYSPPEGMKCHAT